MPIDKTDYSEHTAVELFELSLPRKSQIIDIGAGPEHAPIYQGGGDTGVSAGKYLSSRGHGVVEVDYGRNGVRFEDLNICSYFAGVHTSHMLEHVRNVGIVLDKIHRVTLPGGYICILVPPAKHNIVGGHLSLWNVGLLLYNLIRAHIDCSDARVRTYGYNVAVIARNIHADYNDEALYEDNGDIELLEPFFPFHVWQGFDGRVLAHNWSPFPSSDE
jgi:SAM-dependent methyltransferase